MQLPIAKRWAQLALGLSVLVLAQGAGADTVLSQISLRSRRFPHSFYAGTFEFPANVREYSDATLRGYSFRQQLPSGGVRELEISRIHTRGAYVLATDLFPNGRFSTMSHTVLMVFPRDSRSDPYVVTEDADGNLRVSAPDGSTLLIDGATGAVRPTRDFFLAPQGRSGTPPGLYHRGLHLEVQAVGRSPFLRETPVRISDATGWSCTLSTDEIFQYRGRPESDVFRFDADSEFFAYLSKRCRGWRAPPAHRIASASAVVSPAEASPSGGVIPLLLPSPVAEPPRPAVTETLRSWPTQPGGTLQLLWQLLSH